MNKLIILSICCLLVVAQVQSQCTAGTYTDPTNSTKCLSCGPGALTCTGASAYTGCSSGWFSNPLTTGVGCSQCNSTSTLTCSSGVVALTCKNGFYLTGGICVPCASSSAGSCASTCTGANAGFVSVGSTCVSCLSSTAACAGTCPGFYTSGSSCLACPANALTCTSANVATSCAAGFYISAGGACAACPVGQLQCTTASVVSACKSGFYLSTSSTGTKSCVACASSTASCNPVCLGFNSTSTSCTACTSSATLSCDACSGYGFYSGTVTTTGASPVTTLSCNACPAGVASCSQSSTTDATKNTVSACLSGYYLGANGVCALCSTTTLGESANTQWTNQATCTAAPVALTCPVGSFVNQTSCVSCASTIQNCVVSCLTQGFFSGNTTVPSCTACATGALSCVNATYSTSCSSTGYWLSSSTCVALPTGATGMSGNAYPESTVGGCLSGFYYFATNKTCLACGEGADTCTDINTATACKTGYSATLVGGTCVQCQTGATRCEAKVSLSCDQGFFLQEGKCSQCQTSGNANDAGSDACYDNVASTARNTGCRNAFFLGSDGSCTSCGGSNSIQCAAASQHTVCDTSSTAYWVAAPYAAAGTCGTTSALTGSAQGLQLVTTFTSGCRAGYFLYVTTASSVSSCVLCSQSSNVLSCSTATTVNACNAGYVKLNNNCYACYGKGATCTINSINLAKFTCATLYFQSDVATCTACTDASLKAADGVSTLLGQAQIKTCSGAASGPGKILQSGFTCNSGYTAISFTYTPAGSATTTTGPGGCLACEGLSAISAIVTTNAAKFLSCDAPDAINFNTASNQVQATVVSPATILFTINNVVCKQGTISSSTVGHFWSAQATSTATTSGNTCTLCTDTSLKGEGGTANALFDPSANGLINCKGAADSGGKTAFGVKLQPGYDCATGYTKVSYQISAAGSSLAGGCLSCAGVATVTTNAAATNFVSCDALPVANFQAAGASAAVTATVVSPATILTAISNVVCTQATDNASAGYFWSAQATSTATTSGNTCAQCSSATLRAGTGTSPVWDQTGAPGIYNCKGASSGAGVNLQSDYTCQTGFAKISYTLSGSTYAGGCLSCAGAATATTNTAATNFVSCTAPSASVFTASSNSATITASTIAATIPTNVVCKQASTDSAGTVTVGFFWATSTSTANTCVVCTDSALKAGDGTSTVFGQAAIYGCSGASSGAGKTLQSSFTCITGYVPFQFYNTAGTAVQAGCFACSGLTSTTANAVITGYSACAAPNGYLFSLVTANTITYTQLVANTDQEQFGSAHKGAYFTNTACSSGFSLSSTSGLCVYCTDVATLQNAHGNDQCTIVTSATGVTTKTPTACKSHYVLANKGSPQCIACLANSPTCSATATVVLQAQDAAGVSSGYLRFTKSGQVYACPTNAVSCIGPVPSQCNSGFFVSNGACVSCANGGNIVTCTSVTYASTCANGYYQVITAAVGATAATAVCTSCANGGNIKTCTSTTYASSCMPGYFQVVTGATAVCTACSSTTQATTCSSALSTAHTACITGYSVISGTCTQCQSGAAGVSACTTSADSASACSSGYYMAAQAVGAITGKNVCYPCAQNVASCTSYSSITTCNNGYSKVGSACIRCPAGAVTCSSTSVALTCTTGYFLSNSICVPCTSNAATCSSSTYVTLSTQCATGYFASSGTCSACNTGMATCTAAATASSCSTGFYYDSTANTCTQCGLGANACTSATAASSCIDGYSLIGAGATKCTKCTVTGAKACATSAGQADSCLAQSTTQPIYYSYISASNTCVACPLGAATCTSTSVASTPISGYVVQGTVAIPCLPGTASCTSITFTCSASLGYVVVSGVCTVCASSTVACPSGCSALGFFQGTASCTRCDPNASACTSATAASACNSGYYLSGTSCTACPNGGATCTSATSIQSCAAGFFGTTSCTSCGANTQSCTDASTAVVCKAGFYMSAAVTPTCVACPSGATCQLLSSAVTCAASFYPLNGACYACASTTVSCTNACLTLGFFSSATACTACATGATACVSATVATACSSGYYLDNAGVCQTCADTNAAGCPLVTSLSSCLSGYSLVNSTCVQCPSNFATCTNSTSGLLCKSGYYLSSGSCVACPSQSLTCTSATAFQICAPTYYPTAVSGQDVTCTACPTSGYVVNCYNASYATSCQSGYYPINGTCQSCPTNSATCAGTTVLTCKSGFYLVNNTCNACGTGASTCTNTTALTCMTGYGLSGSSCVQCGSGASSCTSATVATACYSGMVLSASGSCACNSGFAFTDSNANSCSACSSNCASCSSPTQCTTCNSPYSLSNGVCTISCQNGTFINGTSCASCLANCASCASASVCQACSAGFSLQTVDATCLKSYGQQGISQSLIMMIGLLLAMIIIKQ